MYPLIILKISKHKYSPSETHTHARAQKNTDTQIALGMKRTQVTQWIFHVNTAKAAQVILRNNSVVDLHFPTGLYIVSLISPYDERNYDTITNDFIYYIFCDKFILSWIATSDNLDGLCSPFPLHSVHVNAYFIAVVVVVQKSHQNVAIIK
jgi:hypothetical protein